MHLRSCLASSLSYAGVDVASSVQRRQCHGAASWLLLSLQAAHRRDSCVAYLPDLALSPSAPPSSSAGLAGAGDCRAAVPAEASALDIALWASPEIPLHACTEVAVTNCACPYTWASSGLLKRGAMRSERHHDHTGDSTYFYGCAHSNCGRTNVCNNVSWLRLRASCRSAGLQ